jgi:pyroglutamyl-peptidase
MEARMKKKSLLFSFALIFILTCSSLISSQSTIQEKSTIVLVTGFGPFSKFDINPSEIIAEELDGEIINGAKIIGLPVHVNLSNFTESIDIVYQAIEYYNPDYIISIGLAASDPKIRIEKIGYNLKIEEKEDKTLEKLITNGRWLRFSPFPALKIVNELRKEDIPSRVSLHGGYSLCNGLLYSLLHYIDEYDLQIKSGFIHIPLHKTEENPDGMELQTMFDATKIIIQTYLDN